jgi:hypothetical protein
MRARDASIVLWERHGLSLPVDLRSLAEALGLEVVSFPFNGRIREIIIYAKGCRAGGSGGTSPTLSLHKAHYSKTVFADKQKWLPYSPGAPSLCGGGDSSRGDSNPLTCRLQIQRYLCCSMRIGTELEHCVRPAWPDS